MRTLTTSEEIVMKSVWELGGNCTLSQIATQSKEYGKDWKIQTVTTFLKFLVEKKYLRPYKDKKFLHYEILIKEETYKQFIFKKFLDFWWNGNMGNLIQDVLQGDVLSPEETTIFKKYCNSYIN